MAGIRRAFIFGSWARRFSGEAGDPPRDVDVVVIGEPDVDEIYTACQRTARIIGQEVNPVVLTPTEWKHKRSGFLGQLDRSHLVEIVPHPSEAPLRRLATAARRLWRHPQEFKPCPADLRCEPVMAVPRASSRGPLTVADAA